MLQSYGKANVMTSLWLTRRHNDMLIMLANQAKRSKSSLFRAMLDYVSQHRELVKEFEKEITK